MERSFFARRILPFVLLLSAAVLLLGMLTTRPNPDRAERPGNAGVLVRTVQARICQFQPSLAAKGRLQAHQRVEIVPQVGGKVTAVASQLEAGGRFRQGETMLQIEREDYRLALEHERSRLLDARAGLEEARGRHKVSKKELELYREGSVEEADRSLVLGLPRLMAAQAAVEAAKASLAQAKLNLERTTVRAPFDGVVASHRVDVGQVVSSSTPVAELIGVDVFDVLASVPVERLADISADPETGSAARVYYPSNLKSQPLDGRVVRKRPEVEVAGRMAQVLVRVGAPAGSAGKDLKVEQLPLPLNRYVELEIQTDRRLKAVAVPREYVHDDHVHLYRNGQLLIQPVEVLWRQPRTLLVRGIESGDEIVATRLQAPVNGLKLRRDPQQEERWTGCNLTEPESAAGADPGTGEN